MRTVGRAVWAWVATDGGFEAALCGALLYAAWTRSQVGRWP